MKSMGTVLGIVVLVYIGVLILAYFNQRTLIYFPAPVKPSLNAASGLTEITLKTEDGLSLFAWHKAPAAPGKSTIVWFHGNASTVEGSVWRIAPYLKEGFGALLVEYRGYAANPGKPSEDGFYKDGRAAVEWLKANGVAEKDIVLYAESIGGGTAVQMATEYPHARALVLEAPFTALADVAKDRMFWLPVDLLLTDRYDNLSKISLLSMPVIIAHGTKDAVVPYDLGVKLFTAIKAPKTLVTIEEGGHNDLADHNVAEKILGLLSRQENP